MRGDSDAPDFQALFQAAPDAYLVLTPELIIVAASDAYLTATMTQRQDIMGRPLFDVFPADPSDAGATAVANLRASLGRVLRDRLPHAMPVQRYPIRRPSSQGGEFEERHWSPRNAPVLAKDGKVAYILHRVEDVTEVVRLRQQQLEQSKTLHRVTELSERYTHLLDSAPDAIVVIGEDGRIQLVNVQTELLFGYTRDQLAGQPLELLIPERFRRSHVAHLSGYFAQPGPRPMGSSLELYGRRKDASEIPIEVMLSPQRRQEGTTVSAAIRDISERKRLEAAARLTADRLASAVDSIEDAFALFDAEDRLILCNSVFRRLHHTSAPGAMVGKHYVEILDGWLNDIDFPDDAARARFRRERLERRLHEPTSSFDVSLRDGRSVRVMDRRTVEGGIVKTIWDLTDDRRRAEELREARAAAEAASAAKSEFLSSMSHELRTPLNAILGFAQLLVRDQRQPLGERHKERVAQILRGGEHLLRLIDDILDLSRIEAGALAINLERIQAAEVLEDVRRTLAPIAARQEIRLDIEVPPDALAFIAVDRTRFAQILMNLGANAIKYNRPGGRVAFTVGSGSEERLRFTVSDDGIGVPLEKQGKLFQPFQRAGQENGPIEGTGIGLVITKRLAELMDGAVGFHSVPGEGSSFWVEVPTQPHPPDRGPAPAGDTRAPSRPVARQQRCALYVEDNPANVSFMRDLMSSFDDIDLVTAPSAELGLELALARLPDVIIMDINLPGMSGLDALRALQAAPAAQHIPVIALTAAASERDKQRGRDAGFYRYLTKPVQVDEFMAVLEELLSQA